MSKFAWVTLATNDSYSLGALVVAHSLKRVHTAHQLAVLITPGVSEAMKNKLRTVFNVVQEVNLLDSKDEANLALLKRPELGITFTKLHCWRLTQFEKCVFLDADTLVLRNCDELFEREELSAAPDVGWPDCFNSGVYVFQPSLETFSSLMQFAVTNGSFDGGDQGLLNSYFSDWAHKDIAKHLPFVYNTSSVASYSYLPAFKQFGQNTKILHFIGTAKPWLQNFNSETRKVYIPGGYQHLTNFLQYWWDIFCEDVHSRLSTDMSGLAGALAQIHLGEPKTAEQEAYEEHMRRQCWEQGNIDYMGRDSFDNIWQRIKQTLSSAPEPEPAPSSSSLAGRPISPATPRMRASKSRSRSTTPKRDPRDRSPTPQPEEVSVPVEKKEVQIEPPIQEEDDSLSATPQDESAKHTKLPPPVQYDPTTSTTTLTKKVFAGYQQVITTKSPEGKTRTQTKTVYDPSVDDDDQEVSKAGVDAVDTPVKVPVQVTVAPVVVERTVIETVKPLVEPVVLAKKAMPPPPPTPPRMEEQLPTPKPSPRPPQQQMQQQVAQESLAGKQPTIEPVKSVRRKRLGSPPATPPPPTTPQAPPTTITTTTTTTTQSPPLPPPKTVPSKTVPVPPKASPSSPSSVTTTPSKSATPAVKSSKSPLSVSASSNNNNNNHQSPPLPTKPSSRPETRKSALNQPETSAPQTAKDEHEVKSGTPTPPVPPRRKRESRPSRIGKAKK